MGRVVRYLAIALATLIVAALALVHGFLRASLPRIDDDLRAGVSAPVSIERDRLGIPTITAANRTDLAYATGFAHAQDRFFEMDLSRRLAAGELSELIGALTVEQDKSARIFRFRSVAREVMRQATPEERAVVAAYARGVNDGLANLSARPWEYLVLGAKPSPWLPEDTILVVHSMWWQLQYLGFHREILRQEVNERLGGALCASGWKCALSFFYPARTEWDAPAVGPTETYHAPDIPSPEAIDVRRATPRAFAGLRGGDGPQAAAGAAAWAGVSGGVGADDDALVGSNNWAVAGRLTASGGALVANDMHLGLRVPAVWYRARLRTTGADGKPPLDLTGATLPGAPLLVVGSNRHIAWGFTNSYGKWLSVTPVACTGATDTQLQGAAGTTPLQVQWEEIKVHGRPSVRLAVRSAPQGVLLEVHPESGKCWFGSWLAQVPEATNLHLMDLERVDTAQEAIALGPRIGIPHQNVVVGDRDGHIGWTIFGRVPSDQSEHRAGGHSAWADDASQPHVVDPESGRLWSANARVTSDSAQEAAIGAETASLGSEYDLGARARQIRDDLQAIDKPATPADMLQIQLDDRAVFLARWRDLLLKLLDDPAVRGNPGRAEVRRLVESWDPRADTGSVGYRIVRGWHEITEVAAWDMVLSGLRLRPEGSFTLPNQFEEPLWQLVTRQPVHFLSSAYANWRDFLLAQVDATAAQLMNSCGTLDRCTWGRHNTIRVRHPLSAGLPFLARFLDMPTVEIPGDRDMPRVQAPTFGQSERFAVSPGHEAQGYFHMPGGQSGHPLSPYYRAGFTQWLQGQPLPFLPGPTEHTQTLRPLN